MNWRIYLSIIAVFTGDYLQLLVPGTQKTRREQSALLNMIFRQLNLQGAPAWNDKHEYWPFFEYYTEGGSKRSMVWPEEVTDRIEVTNENTDKQTQQSATILVVRAITINPNDSSSGWKYQSQV